MNISRLSETDIEFLLLSRSHIQDAYPEQYRLRITFDPFIAASFIARDPTLIALDRRGICQIVARVLINRFGHHNIGTIVIEDTLIKTVLFSLTLNPNNPRTMVINITGLLYHEDYPSPVLARTYFLYWLPFGPIIRAAAIASLLGLISQYLRP